jgi:hypothetical protein
MRALLLTLLLAADPSPGFKLVHLDELVARLEGAGRHPLLYDADAPEFRSWQGALPGAHLLPSYRRYDPARELPADKGTPLVFYCASAA